MTAPAAAPRFVPAAWDPLDPAGFEPLFRTLAARPVETVAQLEDWLLDFSELWAAIDEGKNRRFIAHSCKTDDEEVEKAYLHVVEVADPALKPLFFELQRKLVDAPAAAELPAERYEVLVKRWRADVELYRPENVPLETAEAKLVSEYDKICGAMTVNFDGREYTLPQMGKFMEDPQRDLRERAWRCVQERRRADADRLEGIYDELLALRRKIAAQAELPDYREFVWRQTKRFDYTPADCGRFAEMTEKWVVPLVKRLHARRQARLGVETLRPWDLAVDPAGLAPLKPFAADDIPKLVSGCAAAFDAVSPELGADFRRLKPGRNLDLDSRKGKAPGGYQASLEEVREPFIFMNAAGLQNDVIVLLHEAGHAFHFQAACHDPIVFLRGAPLEFCEVASMSMEWIAIPHLHEFYGPEDLARAAEQLAERVVTLFPWIATVDSFQHWIYTHPGHTPDERAAEWLRLTDRFGGGTDWTGLEDLRRREWMRQLHLYHYPFYYIEYGLAQLGALQLWLHAKQDAPAAVAAYRKALALGGTRPLPELFAAAGVRFDWTDDIWQPLTGALCEVLRLER